MSGMTLSARTVRFEHLMGIEGFDVPVDPTTAGLIEIIRIERGNAPAGSTVTLRVDLESKDVPIEIGFRHGSDRLTPQIMATAETPSVMCIRAAPVGTVSWPERTVIRCRVRRNINGHAAGEKNLLLQIALMTAKLPRPRIVLRSIDSVVLGHGGEGKQGDNRVRLELIEIDQRDVIDRFLGSTQQLHVSAKAWLRFDNGQILLPLGIGMSSLMGTVDGAVIWGDIPGEAAASALYPFDDQRIRRFEIFADIHEAWKQAGPRIALGASSTLNVELMTEVKIVGEGDADQRHWSDKHLIPATIDSSEALTVDLGELGTVSLRLQPGGREEGMAAKPLRRKLGHDRREIAGSVEENYHIDLSTHSMYPNPRVDFV